MIYFAQLRNQKPQRIDEEHAHDFYQMWFGNNRGQEKFDAGDSSFCPDFPQLTMWGEDFEDSTWFKKILQGEYQEGYFDIEQILDAA